MYKMVVRKKCVHCKILRKTSRDFKLLFYLENCRLKDASVVDVGLGLAMAGRDGDDPFRVRDDAVTRLDERS